MSKTYVFHHDDLDGIAGSLILSNYYNNVKRIVCSYEGETVNPLNIIGKNDMAVIVDYSFSPEIMKKLYYLLGDKLIWLDHHISAINNSKKYGYDKIRGIRDVRYCGTELSWEWCVPNRKSPLLIKLIGDFDTFRTYGTKRFNDALCLLYGIKSYDEDALKNAIYYCYINDLDYAERYYYNFMDAGKVVFNYKINEYKENGEQNSYVKNIWGLRVLCMNTSEGGLCLQLPKIYNPNNHDMILTYNFNGQEWCYGFYTDVNNHPEVDCSAIASQYGGGGHKGAAGAKSKTIIEGIL